MKRCNNTDCNHYAHPHWSGCDMFTDIDLCPKPGKRVSERRISHGSEDDGGIDVGAAIAAGIMLSGDPTSSFEYKDGTDSDFSTDSDSNPSSSESFDD